MGYLGRRKERRLIALEELRQVRRLMTEDVTVFGEQLADLHVETMTTDLDEDMRRDHQRALDLYDEAKHALTHANATGDLAAVRAVEPVLTDGRFHLACALARRDGVDLPQRREPCFFNPQHGPAVADLPWAPPGGGGARSRSAGLTSAASTAATTRRSGWSASVTGTCPGTKPDR